MEISIVIPAYIKTGTPLLKLTINTLDQVFLSKGVENCEVILVDDGGDVKCIDLLKRRFEKLKIVSNSSNQGFARSINVGINNSTKDKILLLNNDVQIKEKGWLLNLLNGMEYFKADIVSPKQSILNERFEYIPDAVRHKYIEERCFSYPVGWCVLVKRKVFEEVGLFPENFGVGFWEDTAWFYNIKKLHPNIKTQIIEGIDKVQIQHLEHQTFKSAGINITEQYTKNRAIFLKVLEGKVKLELPRMESKCQ